MTVGNLGDVFGPVFPVAAVAALGDDLGKHGVLPLAQFLRIEGKAKLLSAEGIGFLVAAAHADDVHHAIAFACQVDGGELLVQPVIVGTQSVEHLPDHAVLLVVIKCRLGRGVLADADGQNHIAVLLAASRVFAHHATDRLHHVHHGIAGVQENGSVQRRDIHAFGEAAGIGQDAAYPLFLADVVLEPGELLVALDHVHGAIDVFGLQRGEIVDLVAEVGGNALELGGQQFGVLDRLREGDGSAHRLRIDTDVDAILGGNVLAQAVPAANDFHRVIQLEFIAAVGDALVEHPADVQLINSDHQHLVVGQQIATDSFIEAKLMEHRAEGGHIVHREHLHIVFFSLALAGFGVDARRGGHVKPLVCLDVGVVMDAHECGMIFAGSGIARSAVCLIAHHQVEHHAGFLLRLMYHFDGLIGREDHRDGAFVLRCGEGSRQLVCIRRGRISQFVDAHVFFIAAGLAIRAHSKAAQRHTGIGCPRPQRLRQQRDGRHQEQDVLARLNHLLGNDERGVGFACAAGHDELATVVGLKAFGDIGQSFALMRARGFLGQLAQLIGLVQRELRPVNRGGFQVLQGYQFDRNGLPFQRIRRVLGERRSCHDKALGKATLAREGEEVTQIAQRNRGVVELALDCAVTILIAQLRHQVDAGVRQLVAEGFPLRPILPEPDIFKQCKILRVELEVSPHQPLEAVAQVTIESGFVPVLLEDVTDHVNKLLRFYISKS
ncbi:hypothetical protein FEP72_06292 [Burkholderia multivorans]|nr:hypothetical protein [Burkholderia multivorans]